MPHLVKKIKGFPLKVKSYQNTATYQKLGGVVESTPPPLLLRGKDVFCVLPTGFDKSLIYWMFVHAKSSSSSVQRPTAIVISPG